MYTLRQYHLAAVGSAEPRDEALHSWRLPGDDVQEEALELVVRHVAVEEVGEAAEGITHEAEHGHRWPQRKSWPRREKVAPWTRR